MHKSDIDRFPNRPEGYHVYKLLRSQGYAVAGGNVLGKKTILTGGYDVKSDFPPRQESRSPNS